MPCDNSIRRSVENQTLKPLFKHEMNLRPKFFVELVIDSSHVELSCLSRIVYILRLDELRQPNNECLGPPNNGCYCDTMSEVMQR